MIEITVAVGVEVGGGVFQCQSQQHYSNNNNNNSNSNMCWATMIFDVDAFRHDSSSDNKIYLAAMSNGIVMRCGE